MQTLRVWQGTDELINITHNYPSLVTAQQITVYIDTPSQIIKTLGDGISNVTANDYLLTIAAADTNEVPSGEYAIQAKIKTSGGSELAGQIQPSTIQVRRSLFTQPA